MDLGGIILSSWASFGVIIDKTVEDRENNRVIMYVEVPEFSEEMTANNEMMAGEKLARRLKECLADMGLRVQIRYKVCKGVHWTKEMGKTAQNNAIQAMYPYRNIPGVNC